jgi:diguanylate cyclase (GGDEF)-like protein/PAS domain S-box-containing protein
MEQRLDDQMQLIALANDRREIEDILRDSDAKRASAEFGRVRRRMGVELEDVLRNEGAATKKSVRADYAAFIHERAVQVAALRSHGRLSSVKGIGHTPFDRQLDQLRRSFGRRVLRWSVGADELGISTFLVTAFLVVFSTAQYRKHAFRSASQEVTRRTAEAGERRFRALIQNNSDVIVVTTADGKIKLASDACIGAWGKAPADVLGKPIFRLLDKECASSTLKRFEEFSMTGVAGGLVEVQMADGEGALREYEARIVNLLPDPDIAGVLWTFHEVTERRKFEAEMTRRAFHDVLTSLPNRALFLDRLTHRLTARAKTSDGFAVLFIDLDNFKVVNDSLGHAAGDELILTIATRLVAVVRPCDTVARLGGDEFTILLDEARNSDYAMKTAKRVLTALAEPVILASRAVHVGASIGIAMSAESGFDGATMLRDADTAMYRAKARGKNGYSLFDPTMGVDAINRLEIESDLRDAMAAGQLFLEYQPIVEVASGRVVEVEGLVRWNHPRRGLVLPLDFIPVAEETGLIAELGDWALREACAQLGRWRSGPRACRGLRMNVNVSARQLRDPRFVKRVREILRDAEIDPALLGLEITETTMLQDLTKIREAFEELRSIGVRVVIDDFGAGYSSMAYLDNLPIDMLKIDRSFVAALGQANSNRGVVQAMITLGRDLGLEVTTEGIETVEQLQALREMGCPKGQGFLFSKAVSTAGIASLVAMSENLQPISP